jgi:RNA polymerase sigma-70 factor (ECF subfamily)
VHVQTDIPATAAAALDAPFDFDATITANYRRIARVIVRIVGDPARAEDLAVDTFARLLLHPQAQGAGVEAWLYRTAVRLGIDELRRRSRRQRVERWLPFIRPPQTPDAIFSESQERSRVRAVLGVLSRRHTELLLMRNEGLSHEDIARALSVKPASVTVLLSRARQAFRKEYVKRYGQR